MKNKLPEAILDADICIKLGGYVRDDVLSILLPLMTKKAYIHEYVWNQEILQPAIVRERLQRLIDTEAVSILGTEQLEGLDKILFDETVRILSHAMQGTIDLKDSHHKGEIVTLSMAKAKGIPVFISDESRLQSIIDVNLNSGTEYDIHVMRLKQVIVWIKENPECGISRKTAKKIWCGSCDRQFFDKYKNEFDYKIWPTEDAYLFGNASNRAALKKSMKQLEEGLVVRSNLSMEENE